MDLAAFSQNLTGQLVPITDPSPLISHAFVPDPLPPKWEWPTDLYPLLIDARAALASLDGTGKHLPSPDIVLRPIQRREARLSSKLEGTITDPQQQALFDAEPTYPTSPSDPVNAYREIFNYGQALRYRLDGAGATLPLSKRLIRDLHAVLMNGVRGHEQRPGEFRTIQNQIDDPPRFVPPPPTEIEKLLDDFEQYLNSSGDYDPLVRAFLAHYQFEAIHPFRDGNGRVGRLLLAICIAEWCGLSNQWLYMSAFFEQRKADYMSLLLRISTHGDWAGWIAYCLEGVVAQARDTELRCERLLTLHRDFHERLTGGSVRLAYIVDRLFFSPIVTVTRMRTELEVTYPTARADLAKLERLGILQRLDGMRRITYYCDPIYEVVART